VLPLRATCWPAHGTKAQATPEAPGAQDRLGLVCGGLGAGLRRRKAFPTQALITNFRALGKVHPIVFGAYGEVSEGTEVLIGKLADAWARTADRRSLISICSWTTCSPRRASRGASYGRKSERPASTRTRTSSLGARGSASQATARRAGGAETKTSDSIELERRNKRHGASGGTGHLVACPLAGGASSWLGWVAARRRGGRA
jgi:hypothetical protein